MSDTRSDTAPPPVIDADGKVADTGPVLDTGGSSIDDERGGADDCEEQKRGAPPETALPPD